MQRDWSHLFGFSLCAGAMTMIWLWQGEFSLLLCHLFMRPVHRASTALSLPAPHIWGHTLFLILEDSFSLQGDRQVAFCDHSLLTPIKNSKEAMVSDHPGLIFYHSYLTLPSRENQEVEKKEVLQHTVDECLLTPSLLQEGYEHTSVTGMANSHLMNRNLALLWI